MPKNIITNLKFILDSDYYSWKQIDKINNYVRLLRDLEIPNSYLSYLNLEKSQFGAWDDSLSLYCEEILNNKLRHTHTHFSRYYENLRVIGKIKKNIHNINRLSNYNDIINCDYNLLSYKNINEYNIQENQRILIDSDGYIFAYLRSELNFSNILQLFDKNTQSIILKYISKTILNKPNKVLRILLSIERYGWQPETIKNYHNIIVARSRITGRFSVLTGRHRIAAIRYLIRQGIALESSIKCLILEHTGSNFLWNSNFK